ncbi:zinc-ribbon domain-containing protein [Marinicrinis lubricantis]|uniref:Zinc-ribbon domain-containing protein n=1 Tax=Marinicrinis lubricantis TaxID=2086470 RepID=A0ABW1IKU1_9BACL
MNCPTCSEKLTNEARFCPNCGARLPETVETAEIGNAEVQRTEPNIQQAAESVNEGKTIDPNPAEREPVMEEAIPPIGTEKVEYIEQAAETAEVKETEMKMTVAAEEPAQVRFFSLPTLIYFTLSVLLILFTCAEVWSS